jgi:5-methyltetrahydrofolate--homocysteine methyltransferase
MNPIPTPPFWGIKCIEHIPLRAIVPYINKIALYKFHWGFKKSKEYGELEKTTLNPLLNRLIAQSESENILQLKAVYGYFPCQSQGNHLIIYQAIENNKKICRFDFPRQTTARRLCIADFFRSVDSNEIDVVAFQLVTVGQYTSDFARKKFESNEYQEYLYWHGLNAEGAEALAEYIHRRIRIELGFGSEDARQPSDMIKQKYRGARYSFGYPACPHLADQQKILNLLEAHRIGVVMGEEYQLVPEESTSALVVHHPDAKYFGV